MRLSRALMRRLSRLRRDAPEGAPPAGAVPIDRAPPGGAAPAADRIGRVDPGRIDRIYQLPPVAPARPSPGSSGVRSAESGRGRAPARGPIRSSWVDLPVLRDPPPFVPIDTDAGPVRVRRMSVTLPGSLRRSLARLEHARCAKGRAARSVVLDTETTGFGSPTLFLVGLAWLEGGSLALEQILASDHAREAALLHRLEHHFHRAGRLVTYNGRSYDLPLIRDRAARHRLRALPQVEDLDLLTLARRRWRRRLRDCRLSTLEREVLGRTRRGDVDGRDVGDLYIHSVRAGDPRILAPVLHHNALDLLATMELLAELDGERDDGERDGEKTHRERDPREGRGHPIGRPSTTS